MLRRACQIFNLKFLLLPRYFCCVLVWGFQSLSRGSHDGQHSAKLTSRTANGRHRPDWVGCLNGVDPGLWPRLLNPIRLPTVRFRTHCFGFYFRDFYYSFGHLFRTVRLCRTPVLFGLLPSQLWLWPWAWLAPLRPRWRRSWTPKPCQPCRRR